MPAFCQDRNTGDIWMFGGEDLTSYAGIHRATLNDLWKFDGTNWTLMGGSVEFASGGSNFNGGSIAKNEFAVYHAPSNRHGSHCSVDSKGNVWIFGGEGLASNGVGGYVKGKLSDLWKFDISIKQFAWFAGPLALNGSAITSGASATPSATASGTMYRDELGKIVFFGGINPSSNYPQSSQWRIQVE
jgi:hypothetical protein